MERCLDKVHNTHLELTSQRENKIVKIFECVINSIVTA